MYAEKTSTYTVEYMILFPVIRIPSILARIINNFVVELLFSEDLLTLLITEESIDRYCHKVMKILVIELS